MITHASIQKFFVMILLVSTAADIKAEEPAFKSELFETGKLIYSDDFDGELDKERWGVKKLEEIKDGFMVITARSDNVSPLASFKNIPEKFVCHIRYKFEAAALEDNRPILQIGHHMILLNYIKGGGHSVSFPIPEIPNYEDVESNMTLNEWVDLILEYREGKILISVNGSSKIIEDERVTIDNKKGHGTRFTFKHGIVGPKSRIVFDYVRLWECKE